MSILDRPSLELEVLDHRQFDGNLDQVPIELGRAALPHYDFDESVNQFFEEERRLEILANPEAYVFGQIEAAIEGYSNVVAELNSIRERGHSKTEALSQEQVLAQLSDWLTNDKTSHLKERMKADPELEFTLVLYPNEEITALETIQLAEKFGDRQGAKTSVESAAFLRQYSPTEISGNNSNDRLPFRIGLIPNKQDPEMSYIHKTVADSELRYDEYGDVIYDDQYEEAIYGRDNRGDVDEQTTLLKKSQIDMPFLQTTTPFEDLVYFYTLQAKSAFSGSSSSNGVEYFTRNIEMEPRKDGLYRGQHTYLFVPSSYILDRRLHFAEPSIDTGKEGAYFVIGSEKDYLETNGISSPEYSFKP